MLARDDILARLEKDGISEWACDYFGFGYGDKWNRPALSIPWSVDGELTAMQYRFFDTGEPRYVFEKGTMGDIFNIDCLTDKQDDCVLIVEGAKKAATLWSAGITSVCALVSKTTWRKPYAEWFRGFSRVYVALDPDATEQAREIAAHVPNGRLVITPRKIDDFLVQSLSGDVDALWSWVQCGRRVKA